MRRLWIDISISDPVAWQAFIIGPLQIPPIETACPTNWFQIFFARRLFFLCVSIYYLTKTSTSYRIINVVVGGNL